MTSLTKEQLFVQDCLALMDAQPGEDAVLGSF